MSAFAAIVSLDPRTEVVRHHPVAAALARVYGTAPATHLVDGCVLLGAPSPEPGAACLVSDGAAGVSAVGHVLLEGRLALAHELELKDDVPALRICVAAYLRWGQHCTSRLSGEFSFALWDGRDRALLCARDGLGVRQLFVACATDAIVISNTSTATVAYAATPRDLDDASLVRFLASGSLETGRTAYRAVTPLPPGHTLRLDVRRTELWRHWHFPETGTRLIRRPQEAVAGYREVLESAVRDRLTTSRASILMSGGIDSTSIAAAARSAAPGVDLQAFTAVYDRVPDESELPRARLAAGALGLPLVPVVADRHGALHHLSDARPTPQPVDEPSLTDWRVLMAAAASYSGVALYGEDGDSLFLPPGYAALRRASPWFDVCRDALAFTVADRRPPYLGLRFRERLRIRPPANRPRPAPAWLAAPARALLLEPSIPSLLGQRPNPLPPHATRPLAQARLEAGTSDYMAGIIAAEITRAPLDLRCPLLDSRVVRFVMNVAAIPWCQDKRLARAAYRHILPAPVYTRPKRGVKGLDRALAREWLSGATGEPRLPSPLDQWIDVESWRLALRSVSEVGAAWRVLQLAAWLDHRAEAGEARDLCTA